MGRSSTVVLAACEDYDPQRVYSVVSRSLAVLGLDALPRKKPALLKPNLLLGAAPEKGVTTHPAVFSAVARHLLASGFSVVYGDSPNGMFRPVPVARRCGILPAAESLGIPMADFDTGEDISYSRGAQNRRFHVARGVLDSGFMVNLPKLKTHAFTIMTGALKNTFGVIPGMRKAEFHITNPDVEGFSRMLADLNGLVRSRLVVMDAVQAMEGNGPSGGRLVNLGAIIVSEDPVAVDAVACRLMGLDPHAVPLIRMAEEAGIGRASAGDIEVVGSLAPDVGKVFALPTSALAGGKAPRLLMRFAKRLVVPRPVIDARKCARCGQCVEACPARPKALAMPAAACRGNRGKRRLGGRSQGGRKTALAMEQTSVPRYDYGICIRCYCCQEICPEGAISVTVPILGRLFEKTPQARDG